ncbi:MAG: LysM peptidoglycan-binding domain-containing protein [Verrucomicrobia bacterium]|nr:LysM peptidoglycan-binding domain-containing protein [Verrucomicrobiota bacterium]
MNLIAIAVRRSLFTALVILSFVTGCSTLAPQPAMNLAEPGWVIREGQVAWKASADSAEIRGQLLVALHADGRNVVQFTAASGERVQAQFSTNFWQAQLPGQQAPVTGRGKPPQKIIWLQLPEGLLGNSAEETDWMMSRERGKPWRFYHDVTGESLEGTLVTTRMPARHRVQPGEHIIRVVRRYGITVEALRAVNPGRDLDWFRVGNDINLPEVKVPVAP